MYAGRSVRVVLNMQGIRCGTHTPPTLDATHHGCKYQQCTEYELSDIFPQSWYPEEGQDEYQATGHNNKRVFAHSTIVHWNPWR